MGIACNRCVTLLLKSKDDEAIRRPHVSASRYAKVDSGAHSLVGTSTLHGHHQPDGGGGGGGGKACAGLWTARKEGFLSNTSHDPVSFGFCRSEIFYDTQPQENGIDMKRAAKSHTFILNRCVRNPCSSDVTHA